MYGILAGLFIRGSSYIITRFVSHGIGGDFVVVEADVHNVYEIENRKINKYAIEAIYEVSGSQYVVYVFSPIQVEASDDFEIEYDVKKVTRCCYKGKEYVAQPLDRKIIR